MPTWALQIIIASIPLLIKLVDKLCPSMVHHKKEFRTKKKVLNTLEDYRDMTITEIVKKGKRTP